MPPTVDRPRLSFHGAAGTVTGSRHLLEVPGCRLLVDCGLFQGLKELRLRNWQDPGFEPGFLDHVVLTHAHIDHTGWVPRLMQYGYRGPLHCTPATAELAELMLMDSAHLQEEDAAYANKQGYSKHQPAEPLYTSIDALAALKLLRPHDYGQWRDLGAGVRLRFGNSGHILGAAFAEVRFPGGAARGATVNDGETTVVFGGDLGRYGVPLHTDPEPLPACDALVLESTYGDRDHTREPVLDQIRAAFAETVRRRGIVLIPSFAVARAQLIGLILRDLMRGGDLPEVPLHIDSPMAIDATLIYSRHLYDGNLDPDVTEDGRSQLFPRKVHLHRTVHESKQLNHLPGPRVIIASSGMMTGGRILHHLVRRLPEHHTLVLLTGYQAVGTRGRSLQEGAATLRMHGQNVPVNATVMTVEGLSSHADRGEILRWVATAPRPPRRIFVVHGEPEASAHLAERLREVTGAEVTVPGMGEGFDL